MATLRLNYVRPPVIPRDSSHSTAHFHPFPSECLHRCLQVVSKDTCHVIIRTALLTLSCSRSLSCLHSLSLSLSLDFMLTAYIVEYRERRGERERKSDLPGSFLLPSPSHIDVRTHGRDSPSPRVGVIQWHISFQVQEGCLIGVLISYLKACASG